MNITYPDYTDEEDFRKAAPSIYDEIYQYNLLVYKHPSHPYFLTYSEWRIILSEILQGLSLFIKKKSPTISEKSKINRSLFLLCRYFYDLRS